MALVGLRSCAQEVSVVSHAAAAYLLAGYAYVLVENRRSVGND